VVYGARAVEMSNTEGSSKFKGRRTGIGISPGKVCVQRQVHLRGGARKAWDKNGSGRSGPEGHTGPGNFSEWWKSFPKKGKGDKGVVEVR